MCVQLANISHNSVRSPAWTLRTEASRSTLSANVDFNFHVSHTTKPNRSLSLSVCADWICLPYMWTAHISHSLSRLEFKSESVFWFYFFFLSISRRAFFSFVNINILLFRVFGPFSKHCYFHSLRFNVMIMLFGRFIVIGLLAFIMPKRNHMNFPSTTKTTTTTTHWTKLKWTCWPKQNEEYFLAWLWMQCDIYFCSRSTSTFFPLSAALNCSAFGQNKWKNGWLHNNRNDNIVSKRYRMHCMHVINKIISNPKLLLRFICRHFSLAPICISYGRVCVCVGECVHICWLRSQKIFAN